MGVNLTKTTEIWILQKQKQCTLIPTEFVKNQHFLKILSVWHILPANASKTLGLLKTLEFQLDRITLSPMYMCFIWPQNASEVPGMGMCNPIDSKNIIKSTTKCSDNFHIFPNKSSKYILYEYQITSMSQEMPYIILYQNVDYNQITLFCANQWMKLFVP